MWLAESLASALPRGTPGRDPTIAEKVAFLSQPRAFHKRCASVEAIETHLSWVFLTDRRAYKMKKPLRLDHHDLAGVAAREHHCRMEVRLNRRLCDEVYLGVVPLVVTPRNALALGAPGRPVDWLVKMRRLSASLMLDSAIAAGQLRRRDLRGVVAQLARFYAARGPEPVSGAEVRAHIAARIAESTRGLCEFPDRLDRAAVEELADRQLAFLELDAELIDQRVAAGSIVEGHGDLRPEHICLEVVPRIIDCLDFSRELRMVDPAEELGFLALECERLGAPQAAQWIFEDYAQLSGDRAEPRLVHFYQSVHAGVRANLAIRHLHDAAPRDPPRWPALAARYLQLAQAHLAQCARR